MTFRELLELVGDLPLFRGSLLLAGDRDPLDVRRQLSRWKASGKLVQLRRNVYTLAKPWRRLEPHPFVIANELHRPSYVSMESALAHHGLIPEAVPVTTSVTTSRPATFETPLGRYVYRHIHRKAFFGYREVRVFQRQEALLADAAKALLDLVYMTPGGEAVEYLESLRLEDLEESVGENDLRDHARRWGKPKLEQAVKNLDILKRAGAAEVQE
jgi:predicted transcriptional regulator of viral defense system